MKSLILLPICFLCLLGCSASSESLKDNIEISEIYSWVNLMPGGEPTFHITGKANIDIKLDGKIELEKLQIFQSDMKVADAKTYFTALPKQSTEFIKYSYIFGVKDGLPGSLVNAELPVQLIITFQVDKKPIVFEFENIPIEKVY